MAGSASMPKGRGKFPEPACTERLGILSGVSPFPAGQREPTEPHTEPDGALLLGSVPLQTVHRGARGPEGKTQLGDAEELHCAISARRASSALPPPTLRL